MVFRRLNGKAILEPIGLSSLYSSQQVFQEIKQKHLELVKSKSRFFWLAPLFTRLEVGIADIQWVRDEQS